MNTMKYKGYIALLQYDEDDEEFVGTVINTSQHEICFGGKTVQELQENLAEAIEGYLENCKKLGVEPEKPYSGRVTYRTTPEHHALLWKAALVSGKTSLNSWIDEVMVRESKNIVNHNHYVS